MIIDQQLGLADEAASSGSLKTVANAGSARVDSAKPSTAELGQRKSAQTARLAGVFGNAPAALAREQKGLENAIAAQENPDFRSLGAGVSDIKYDSLTISGSSATAVSEVQTWAHIAMKDDTGKFVEATPVNTLIVTTTLSKRGGQWVITDWNWTFTPSTAP